MKTILKLGLLVLVLTLVAHAIAATIARPETAGPIAVILLTGLAVGSLGKFSDSI